MGFNSILALLISLWSIRLGFFLFYRILKSGEDKRFSEIKYSLAKFFSLWTFSAIWVCITCAPALVVMTSKISDKVDYTLIYIGIIVWLFGFLFETIADFQKLFFDELFVEKLYMLKLLIHYYLLNK